MNNTSSYLVFFSLIFLISCSSSQKKQNNTCQEVCEKWCSIGCYATEGPTKCIYLKDGSMPCCEALAEGLSLDEFKVVVAKNNYRKCNLESKKD